MAGKNRALTGTQQNNDPVKNRIAVGDISVADFTLTGNAPFRAVNASVAGLITIKGFDDQWVQVYVNTGTNPEAGIAIRNRATAATDSATIKAVAIDV